MATELLPLSNFKLQLLSFVSCSRDLQEREGNARKELDDYKQKFKHTEADYLKQLQELRAELDSGDDLRKKLESKIQLKDRLRAQIKSHYERCRSCTSSSKC